MIRILIVDDQKIVREGIKILLEEKTEIEIVGDVADGRMALDKIELLRPNVILLDIDMPGIDGLTLAEKILHRFPEIKIIMLSSHEDKSYVKRATELGAEGYLLKNASSQELEWSIKLVNRGYSAIRSDLLVRQFADGQLPTANLRSNEGLQTQPQQVASRVTRTTTVLSSEDRANLDRLELMLAKKQTKEKYQTYKKPQNRKGNSWFHGVRLTQAKKTLASFEFRLLMFLICCGLGLLVAVALA